MSVLEIKDLHVAIDDKEILKGVNLVMKTGEISSSWDPMVLVNLLYQQQSWAIPIMKSRKAKSCLMAKIF